MPVDHYENFPVASVLLPRQLRPAVETIYRFARSADDIADEGILSDAERLHQLQQYDDELLRIMHGKTTQTELFGKLTTVIQNHQLSVEPFRQLISAFRQDVEKKRYASYAELLDYCHRSADPVGHIMLELYDKADPQRLQASSCICTALQLINFLQDVAIDWKKERIYLPQEDLVRFSVREHDIAGATLSREWQHLMQFQIERTRTLMQQGAWLATSLPGRIGWELRLVVQGGLRILDKIEATKGDVFHQRPTLKAKDWAIMLIRAFGMKRKYPVPCDTLPEYPRTTGKT
jgi:squalene synthase HpnC